MSGALWHSASSTSLLTLQTNSSSKDYSRCLGEVAVASTEYTSSARQNGPGSQPNPLQAVPTPPYEFTSLLMVMHINSTGREVFGTF